jgi:glycosyltransferase involved in cell wall biosynthesis
MQTLLTPPGPRLARAAAPPTVAPIRVAFVLHKMQVAGAEVLVKETIERLGRRVAPVVLCLDAVGPLGRQLQDAGTDVISLDRRPGRDWKVAWRMGRLLRERSIEVVHAHQYTPFFYAALGGLLSGCRPRLILTEHGRHFPDTVAPLRRAVNRLLLDPLADAVNAVCDFSARSLCRTDGFAGGRIEVIENGIDLKRYTTAADRAALRRRLGLAPERRYIACVARLHPVKDQATLLRGFAAVASQFRDVDLLLVGDGPRRIALEELTAELGLGDRIRFLGVRGDVPDILGAVDVFSLTSVSEAASLTLLEAMATALPVVVTDVGGNPEIVRHGEEGLLVPRGDAGSLAAALASLLDDPTRARRLGLAGRQRVESTYRLEKTVAAYYRLYARLTGRSGRGR